MPRNRSLKELSESLLSRKLIPLEDKAFLPILVCGILVFLCALTLSQFGWHEKALQAQSQTAALFVENWAFRNAVTEPREGDNGTSTSRDWPLLTARDQLTPYSLVPTEQFPELLKTNPSFVPASTGDGLPFIVVRHDSALGPGVALAVPASHLNPLLEPLSSQLQVYAVILACSLLSFIIATRVIMAKLIFGPLDTITRTLFARKVFFVTGGIARDSYGRVLDGRHHIFVSGFQRIKHTVMSVLKRLQLKSFREAKVEVSSESGESEVERAVTIERIPEAPRIPLEHFSNDEIGQIALAIEESHQRQQKHQRLLNDVFEAIPNPVFALTREGRIIYANKPFLDASGKTWEDLKKSAPDEELETLLRTKFHFPTHLAQRVGQILDQTAPRIFSKEFEFSHLEGKKTHLLSVSTISYFGKRIAIVVFEDPPNTSVLQMQEIISNIAIQQLKIVQRIAAMLQNPSQKELPAVQNECEHLIDQINALFDIINLGTAQSRRHQVEFNLHSFFKSLPERIPSRHRIELIIPADIPLFVLGDPTRLRQCIKAVTEAFFDANPEIPLRISLQHDLNGREVCVSFGSANRSTVVRHFRMGSFLQKLALFFLLGIKDISEKDEHVFFVFSFPVVQGENRTQIISLDFEEKLTNKELVFLYTAEKLDRGSQLFWEQIKAKRKDLLSYKEVAPKVLPRPCQAIVFFVNNAHWQADPHLCAIVKEASSKGLPTLLITAHPRRGDALHALEQGHTAYLSRPFSVDELEGILMLLTSQEALSTIKSRGLVTRHSLNEVFQISGRVLVSEFDPNDSQSADSLHHNLIRLGFKVNRTTTANQFFEHIYKNNYNYIFFPFTLASGLRRRTALATRGKAAICYATSHYAPGMEQDKDDENFMNVFIRNPADPAEITRALQNASVKWASEELKNNGDTIGVA